MIKMKIKMSMKLIMNIWEIFLQEPERDLEELMINKLLVQGLLNKLRNLMMITKMMMKEIQIVMKKTMLMNKIKQKMTMG